jgi:hypothetical protein
MKFDREDMRNHLMQLDRQDGKVSCRRCGVILAILFSGFCWFIAVSAIVGFLS